MLCPPMMSEQGILNRLQCNYVFYYFSGPVLHSPSQTVGEQLGKSRRIFKRATLSEKCCVIEEFSGLVTKGSSARSLSPLSAVQ